MAQNKSFTSAKKTIRTGSSKGRTSQANRSNARGKESPIAAIRRIDWRDKLFAGTPSRIMQPRLIFICCLVAICLFGLVMVFSASSVESLKENGSPYTYLRSQCMYMTLGALVAAYLSGAFGERRPKWEAISRLAWPAWMAIVVLLALTLVIGTGGSDWGAKRWILIAGVSLQSSEFAKPVIIMVAALLLNQYFFERSIDFYSFLKQMGLCLGVPAILLMLEPDLGSTIIIFATVLCMALIAGMPGFIAAVLVGSAGLVGLVATVTSSYRLRRLLVMLDPWSDPWDAGYQATLAIMAFASGGLFGRGIGNSTMKYNYLPEAQNDYILAIIGEEVGLVGTLIFVAVFLLMLYAGLTIAKRAHTVHAQLLAAGCTVTLGIQSFINVLGILGIIPMTGKPLPFISSGGSSIVSSLILAAIIIRVSVESNQETTADRKRSRMAVMSDSSDVARVDDSSHAHSHRSDRRSTSSSFSVFNVLEGGRSKPYERINLNEDSSDRLRRPLASTSVDYRDVASMPRTRRSQDADSKATRKSRASRTNRGGKRGR